MKKFLIGVWKNFCLAVYLLFSFAFGLFMYGCATTSVIPSTTNPAMEQVAGYKAPSIKMFGFDLTFQGFNDAIEAAADFEHEYTYPMAKKIASKQRERSQNIAAIAIGVLGTATTGSIPFALRKPPKGYVKQEENV